MNFEIKKRVEGKTFPRVAGAAATAVLGRAQAVAVFKVMHVDGH